MENSTTCLLLFIFTCACVLLVIFWPRVEKTYNQHVQPRLVNLVDNDEDGNG